MGPFYATARLDYRMSGADPTTLTILSTSAAETHSIGQQLGQLLGPGQVIGLDGELGAGKTALTQGIARGLGIDGPVTSPTFTLINVYQTAQGLSFYHLDCYRLGEVSHNAAGEAFASGIDEILSDEEAIIVIEWAARIHELLPPDHLAITFAVPPGDPHRRQLTLQASGIQSQAVLAQLRTQVQTRSQK